MARIHFRNNRVIEDFSSPYIIAEINTSHFGRFELAIKMIEAASQAGVDCVKFQSWSETSLYSQTYYDKNPVAKRFLKRFSMSNSQLGEIASYCKAIGIDFASTPYSIPEIDYLVDECDVPFIKVASMDINNAPLLDYLARKNVPIVLSTGMSTLSEISNAVEILISSGNSDIVILHCVSLYPTNVDDINLRNIEGLRDVFPDFPIGFSDHSLGTEISIASVALGAAVIEKHFTLDRAAIGMDNHMAIEIDDLQFLVNSCANVSRSLGMVERNLSSLEMDQRVIMRRSAVAAEDMIAGHVVDSSDICFKRPGNGISPDDMKLIIGKRLKRNVKGDTILALNDFE
jgi:N-acetylneuraminate synthase